MMGTGLLAIRDDEDLGSPGLLSQDEIDDLGEIM